MCSRAASPRAARCLVEVLAALDAGVTIVMKTGRMVKDAAGPGGVRFEGDMAMTQAVVNVIDVAQAEAAVESDRERHLGKAGERPGGLAKLNSDVCSAVRASRVGIKAPAVQAYACGDAKAIDVEGASQEQLDLWAKVAAGSGYVELLRKLVGGFGSPRDRSPRRDPARDGATSSSTPRHPSSAPWW